MAWNGPGRPPSAFKHGLCSRLVVEVAAAEADKLAWGFVGSSPPVAPVVEAAQRAALAELQFRRVRSVRRFLLQGHARHPILKPTRTGNSPPNLPEDNDEQAMDLFITWMMNLAFNPLDDGTPNKRRDGKVAMLGAYGNRDKELERLAECERRAFSRRTKAFRILDYEKLEAERHARASGPRVLSALSCGASGGSIFWHAQRRDERAMAIRGNE